LRLQAPKVAGYWVFFGRSLPIMSGIPKATFDAAVPGCLLQVLTRTSLRAFRVHP
jgi:hypothetical protein